VERALPALGFGNVSQVKVGKSIRLVLDSADEASAHAWIDDWSLALVDGIYEARVTARGFALDLRFAPTQPPLPHGAAGYSRKGPAPAQASYYYSEPQLAVTGTLAMAATKVAVTGSAWLDHEWSSDVMAPGATGWDWTGINLADGGALMAFRMRDAAGGTLWAGGTLRGADGRVRTLAPDEVRFTPRRTWRSPRTGVTYPVAMTVAAGGIELALVHDRPFCTSIGDDESPSRVQADAHA